MRRVKRFFLIPGLLLSLIACAQVPRVAPEATVAAPSETFTPYVAGTQAALASPTAWVGGTETALAAAAASPTPPALPTFTPPAVPYPTFTPFSFADGTFSPVLYGKGPFLLLGAFKQDQGWLSGAEAAQYINTEISYDLLERNGVIHLQGSALEFDPICRNHVLKSAVVLPEPVVGVASGWVAARPQTTDLSIDDPYYSQALTEWFQSQGNVSAEIHISRILRVDLEGDGVDEVLLSASYFKEKFAFLTETGDYSVVLLRRVVGDDIVTIPLVKDYYVSTNPEFEVSYPNTYTLADAVDLNGDGTLEVVVDVRRYEGGGAIVYRVDGQNVREVLRALCPAA